MYVPTPCACCLSTVVMAVLAGIGLTVFLLGKLLTYLLPNQRLGLKIFNWVSTVLHVLIVLVAVGFGVLTTNETARNFTLYKIVESGAVYPGPLDGLRCPNIQNLTGRVLEIGPGPGTNFRCWQNNTHITEWVGVEPNPYFHDRLKTESAFHNITFPTRTVWLKGENVDIEPGTFDSVVGTHVLCSVDDVHTVLRQVSRALKPAGTYHFMEHVAAPRNSSLYTWQQIFEPMFYVVGNGCRFKALWNDLSTTGGLAGFNVSLQFVDASAFVPFPLIAPHVLGTATKL
jgi:SAM-dependent methyltransferase